MEWLHAVFPQLPPIIKLASVGFVQKLGPRHLYQLHSGAWFYLLYTVTL